MIFILDKKVEFPDPELASASGLLAIGGDLGIQRLLLAYNNGIFPWYSDDEPIRWYSPHKRCIIMPSELKVSRSMKKIISENIFTITEDLAFEKVIYNCKHTQRKNEDGTWITDAMQKAYILLHQNGVAHSIEAWQDGELVGGLYGVVVNNMFCGESMFSKVSNASKACLVWLCKSLKYKIVDCQLPNPHLLSLGAVIISRKEYMLMLHST